jgi:uncharacterized protein (DUF58 family)
MRFAALTLPYRDVCGRSATKPLGSHIWHAVNLAPLTYLLAGVTVLLGVLGEWTGEPLQGFWRIPAAALVLALSLEALINRRSHLSISRRLGQRAHLGQPLRGELVVKNPSHNRLRMASLDDWPSQLEGQRKPVHWSVEPGDLATHPFNIVPTALGTLSWSTIHTRTLGVFGLAWWPRRLSVPAQVTVTPDHLHAAESRSGTEPVGDLARRTPGSGLELLGLRDYQPGDPLRAIDWKATARRQRQTVRVFSQEEHTELLVALDCGRTSALRSGPLSRLSHYVNVAARLAEKALRNGDRVGLVTFADRPVHVLPQIKGMRGLLQLRRVLEGLSSLPRESNPMAAVPRIRQVAIHRTLIVLFTDVEEGEAAGQLVRATGLLTPKHLPIIAGLRDQDVMAIAEQSARTWLHPYETVAAMEMDRAVRRTVLHLQRLGAEVVLALPGELDHAVLRRYDESRLRHRA